VDATYDIAVIGGGAAGLCAAVQAARAGCRTLLVEKTALLGGTITSGGVNAPASFHAWGRLKIAGIGWELVRRTLREMGHGLPDVGDKLPVHIGVDAVLFAALADEMVLESGAELLLHTMVQRAAFADGLWRIELCTKTGPRPVAARAVIDCTGDANFVTVAGLPVERSDVLQPGTPVVRVGGYDRDGLDYDALQADFERAVAAGEMRPSDPGWDHGKIRFFLHSYGGNRIHLPGIGGDTSASRTAAELEARRAMLRLYRWCRRQKGLEKFRFEWAAPECGIRETVTIVARKKITLADFESGRVWDDSVCYSLYNIDIHCEQSVDYRRLAHGVFPTIPLGAMIPKDGRRLLAAGRCISGDRESHSAYRVEASCMAMGQAAAAAAVLAVRANTEPDEVPMPELRALLEAHGAIVPPSDGLPPDA